MSKGKYYITTPIYYPSNNLHIGNAYCTVVADTIARYKRLFGYDVFFLTGTDEHGLKIQRKAAEKGVTPLQFVDEIVAWIQNLWKVMDISYDDFIRTTEERHTVSVQSLFQRLLDQNDIYKSEYEGWYCIPCETFWLERQLENGNCPNADCRRPVEKAREESYFFKIQKYQDALVAHLDANPDFIQPSSRRNEMLNFINQGLEDLCLTRTTFDWGIPVPGDPMHVIYVWVDALINYITAVGYPNDLERMNEWWPADVHLVGKEIMRFHTIIWPCLLMAAGLPLPKKVYGHGWLLKGGEKIGKSRGNYDDPIPLCEHVGSDAVRYFLLREMPLGGDGTYTRETIFTRANADLANNYGNLISRTVAMIEKYFGGIIPSAGTPTDLEIELQRFVTSLAGTVEELVDKMELNRALELIWEGVVRCNKYIDDTLPWKMAKDPAQEQRLGTVLYHLVETIRVITVLLGPAIPKAPQKVWAQLGILNEPTLHGWSSIQDWGGIPSGIRVEKGAAVFPRVEWEPEATADEATEHVD